MERIAKQVLNVRGRKGCAAALSREYQRNWSDRAWQVAIAKGNYDLGRQHLNFQISKGGKIAPIDKMVEKLEEFDDVQTVYTNMKPEIPADAE